MNILVAENLQKSFGEFRAVDGISFSIQPGHCFGFLGPNGAGKTTTMKMIYGAQSPTGGSLRIFDLPVQENLRSIKRRLGVVSQRDILEETLTARDNLKIHGRHFGFDAATILQRSDELMQLLQLETRSNEPVFHFSGGMKRRLSIALGLMNKPELLLLDEPTTGLDPQSRHVLWDILRKIKSAGTTILLTTHFMHEAELLCDDLIVIDGGKIIEQGHPRALIEKHHCENLEAVFIKLTGKDLRE